MSLFPGVDLAAWLATHAVTTKIPGSSVTPAQIIAPETMYPRPPAPLPVLTPAAESWTVPPADGAAAEATINDVIARTKAAQDQQASDFFRNSFPVDIGDDAAILPNLDLLLPSASTLAKVAAIAAAALLLILFIERK